MRIKAVQLAVQSALPESMQGQEVPLTAKGISALMYRVAIEHPEQYSEVLKKVGDLGRNAAYWQGETVGLDDLRDALDTRPYFKVMDKEVRDAQKGVTDPDKRDAIRERIWAKMATLLEKDTMKAALASGNSLGRSVASGARGKPLQLRAMLATPALFEDSKGRMIPIFARNSYGRGISPGEFLAGTYGARASVVSTKSCLLKGTLVRMADGRAKPIQDLCVGDMVVGADKEGNTSPVMVTRLYDQGLQEVWRYTLGFGNSKLGSTELLCTEKHKVLMVSAAAYSAARSRYTRGNGPKPSTNLQHLLSVDTAGVLGIGGRASALPSSGWQCGKTEPWAAFFGWILGDGCVTKRRTSFSCADPLMLEHMQPVLESLNLKIRKTNVAEDHYGYDITTTNYNPTMNSSVQSGVQGFTRGGRVPMNVKLEEAGLRGKYAHEKTLPNGIWQWDRESIARLVAAYFACDGSVYSTVNSRGRTQVSISIASTSRPLIDGIKDILAVRFGIHFAGVDVRTKGGFGATTTLRKHTLYSTFLGSVEGVKLFTKLIGPFVPGVKRERLARLADGQVLKQLNPRAKLGLRNKEYVGTLPCFDIEVDNPDHLFVLATGVIVSNSTAKGGFLGKQMAQTMAGLVVTEDDCGTTNGIDLPITDRSLRNRFLARKTGSQEPGSLLDRKALSRLRDGKVDTLLVRSPMTCKAARGVCGKCVGADPTGKLPEIGFAAGVTAANAISEPLTQMALNVKHTSGASKEKKSYSGLDWLIRFVQIPEEFPDRAPVAEQDGDVAISVAPQGGHIVRVGEAEHYVPQHLPLLVKNGQTVEAGTPLSQGVMRPDDIVRLRGLGEGRRYMATRFKEMLDDSGTEADSRNVEMLARASVNHVRILDTDQSEGGILPDDVVPYDEQERHYEPPEDALPGKPSTSLGQFLHVPALHYSIGTRITPSVAERLEKTGFDKVLVSPKAPGFTPEMPRLQTATFAQPDWMAAMGTSYLKRQLSQRAQRGQDSNIKSNIHFAPRLAVGEDFGRNIRTTGEF